MGSLKKFAAWLQGDTKSKSRGNDNLRKAIINLRIFNKRLVRQTKKMEQQAKLSKKKARDARARGDVPGSRMHMKSSLQFQKWANATENFRVRMEGLQYKLEQARAMEDFSNIAQDIAQLLGNMQETIKAPQISELINQLDLGFGNMEAIMSETTEQLEIMDDSSGTAVSDNEVDEALAEIDAELSIDTRSALPSTPGMPQTNESLDDLEAEIQRLKSQRNG